MIEAREAVILVAAMAAERAGAGQGSPATTRATAVSRERRGSEEEVDWFGLTKPVRWAGRFDPVGSDQWGQPKDLSVIFRKPKDLFANLE